MKPNSPICQTFIFFLESKRNKLDIENIYKDGRFSTGGQYMLRTVLLIITVYSCVKFHCYIRFYYFKRTFLYYSLCFFSLVLISVVFCTLCQMQEGGKMSPVGLFLWNDVVTYDVLSILRFQCSAYDIFGASLAECLQRLEYQPAHLGLCL